MFVFSSLGECILERFHNHIQGAAGHLPEHTLDDYRIKVRAQAHALVRDCPEDEICKSFVGLVIRELPELTVHAKWASRFGWLLWAAQEGLDPGPLSGKEEVVFQKYQEHYF